MKIVSVSLKMSSCIICNQECPKPLFKRTWFKERKYCSSKCIKTSYRIKHSEKDKLSKQQWVDKNPEKRKETSNRYQNNNKAYYRAYASLYRRCKLKAKPQSLTEFDELYLLEFYDLAHKRGLEVDHIIPLTHKLVCGLHVPENLQMLTRSQNARKSNKLLPDEDVVAIFKEDL